MNQPAGRAVDGHCGWIGEQKMDITAKQINFTGRVQGVGFRFTVFNIASRCKLAGYVRNSPDGSVEMIAQGSAGQIEDCVRDIERSFNGYISETRVQQAPFNPEYTDFKITF